MWAQELCLQGDGERERAATQHRLGSLWDGWEGQGGGVEGQLQGCLGVRLQPGFTAGKQVSRECCPLCWFPIRIAKTNLFDSEKSLNYKFLETRRECTEAVLLCVCSVFLFPLSFDGDHWRRQGRGQWPVVWSRVLLLCSSKTKSWVHAPAWSPRCHLTATRLQGKGKVPYSQHFALETESEVYWHHVPPVSAFT